MLINIFSSIGSEIDSIANSLLSSISSGYASELLGLAKVCVVLYITIYGFSILAGKSNSSVMSILWDLSRLAFLIGILGGAGGILSGAVGVVDDLKGFFIGGTGSNSFEMLDKRLNDIAIIGIKIWKDADGVEESILAILRIVGLLPLLLGFVACGALLIYSEIIEKILLATAPIFIFCLMWGWLKDSFAQWLSAILGNAMILLFTSVILKFAIKLAELAVGVDSNTQWFTAIVMCVVAGLLSLSSVKWGRELAISLAKISVDRGFGALQNKSIFDRALNKFRQNKS